MNKLVVSLLLIAALAFAFLYQRQSRFTVKTTQVMLGKSTKGAK